MYSSSKPNRFFFSKEQYKISWPYNFFFNIPMCRFRREGKHIGLSTLSKPWKSYFKIASLEESLIGLLTSVNCRRTINIVFSLIAIITESCFHEQGWSEVHCKLSAKHQDQWEIISCRVWNQRWSATRRKRKSLQDQGVCNSLPTSPGTEAWSSQKRSQ